MRLYWSIICIIDSCYLKGHVDVILGEPGKPPAGMVYFSAAVASGEIYHNTM